MELPSFVPSCSAEFPNDNPALHEGASWLCLQVCGAPRPVTRARTVNVRSDIPRAEAIERAPAAPPAKAPSLEALTLSLPPEESSLSASATTSQEPLELDSMDFVTTLASDDPVFEFDGDDATGAVFQVPCVTVKSPSADVARATDVRAAEDPFAAYVAALVDVARAAGHARAASALPQLLEGDELDAAALAEDTRARLVAGGVLRAAEGSVRLGDAFASTASAWRSVLRGATQDLSICGDSTLDGWSVDLLKAFGIGQGTTTDVRRELRRRGVAAFGMLLAA